VDETADKYDVNFHYQHLTNEGEIEVGGSALLDAAFSALWPRQKVDFATRGGK